MGLGPHLRVGVSDTRNTTQVDASSFQQKVIQVLPEMLKEAGEAANWFHSLQAHAGAHYCTLVGEPKDGGMLNVKIYGVPPAP
jgi:hypothetical protein